MKSKSKYKWFLLISSIEGLFVLLQFFYERSEIENSWMLGYSKTRIMLGGVILAPEIALVGLLVIVTVFPLLFQKVDQKLDEIFHNNKIFLSVISSLITFIFFVSIFIIIFPTAHAYQTNNIYQVAYQRLMPAGFWLVIVVLQSLVLIKIRFVKQWEDFMKGLNSKVLIPVFMILLLTVTYWMMLGQNSTLLTSIPDWHFRYQTKIISFSHLYFIFLLGAAIISVKIVYSNKHETWKRITALILIGYFVQIGFGFIAGEGYVSIQNYYAKAPISFPVNIACRNADVVTGIVDYENLYDSEFWLQTKPPGFISLFVLFKEFVTLIDPMAMGEVCNWTIVKWASYLLPLVSMLVIIPIVLCYRKYFEEKFFLLPGALYIFVPSITLMTLIYDQVWFPLFFMLCIGLIAQVIEKKSGLLAAFLGIFIYLVTFVSFSLLPLIGLFFSWVFLEYIFDRQRWRLQDVLVIFLGGGGGFYLIDWIFNNYLNYDMFFRYQTAFIHHKQIKRFGSNIKQLYQALELNNLEFMIWIGIPVVYLVLRRVIISAKLMVRSKSDKKDRFVGAYLITYLGLNLLGQTIGEVARLWLFLVPGLMLIAALEVKSLFPENEKLGAYFVILLQLVTSLFAYQFFVYL